MDFHFLAVLFATKVSDTSRVHVVLSQWVFETFNFIIDFEITENCQERNGQQKYFLLVLDPFNLDFSKIFSIQSAKVYETKSIFELDYPKIVKE